MLNWIKSQDLVQILFTNFLGNFNQKIEKAFKIYNGYMKDNCLSFCGIHIV